MLRSFSESRQPENRRKVAVLRGMRLRHFDSPKTFPGQSCGQRGEGCRQAGEGRQGTCASLALPLIRPFGSPSPRERGEGRRRLKLVLPGRVGAGARNRHRGGFGAKLERLRIAASERLATASLDSAPCSCSEARMPALNVSPAPTVSTTRHRPRRHRHRVVASNSRSRPCCRRVTTMSFGPRSSHRAITSSAAPASPNQFRSSSDSLTMSAIAIMRWMRPRCFSRSGMKSGRMLGSSIVTRVPVLAPHQRLVGRAARLGDEADRAEQHGVDIASERRKVGVGEHPPGRALVVEDIARVPVDEMHEGKRGRPRRKHAHSATRHCCRRAMPRSCCAEQVGRQAGEELDRHAEPSERDRRVEHRAARIGREGRLVLGRRARQHVDQRFAAADDHDPARG